VLQDYPLTLTVIMTPAVIRKIVMDNPSCVMLKARGLRGWKRSRPCAVFQKERVAGGRCPILTAMAGVLDFEMSAAPRRDDRLRLSGIADRCRKTVESGQRDADTTCSTRICR